MFNIVLVEPEIPPNTGSIGRLCVATNSRLHLVQPLGFSLETRELRRAGLDYWEDVDLSLWSSFQELQTAQKDRPRYYFLTTKTAADYARVEFHEHDFLVFGRETKGLPESLLETNTGALLTIPMSGPARSLNLATAVAIVLFEGMRQLRHRTQ